MSRFILLDRDGVINQRILNGYVTCWEQFVFLPGALEGLRLLKQNSYAAIVISNQACVGKGLITSTKLESITRRFIKEVETYGGRICGVYYCPHREEDGCDCRKPKPGLLVKAQREHGFAFADTFLVGDSETDLLVADQVGCPVLLLSDSGRNESQKLSRRAFGVLPSLYAAVKFLLGRDTKANEG